MLEKYIKLIAKELSEAEWKVANCVELLGEGNTIPFISRYRKEQTGGLDDVTIDEIARLAQVYDTLEKRKETILKSIGDRLTEELRHRIDDCTDAHLLEDIYLPYKPRRRTRAQIAREAGVEPLALGILAKQVRHPEKAAQQYVNDQLKTVDEVLAAARDIIAESFNERADVRADLRGYLHNHELISTRTKAAADDDPEAMNYKAYFKHRESINRIPAHRMLAMLRGQEEGYLRLHLDANVEKCREKLYFRYYGKEGNPGFQQSEQVRMAIEDCLNRLLLPSIEHDLLAQAKARADLASVHVFSDNLRQLLLAPPVGQKRTLAVDPGYRNGCKIVCLDESGNLLHHEIIYPHPPQNEKVKSIVAVSRMMNEYDIQAIAIGNGTASRETEDFFKRIPMPDGCRTYLVSEDGASIYSASEIAREEFPEEDVTVRGSVSIGRRLMDPLAELVKIDPKSLGVGQYQHDVDQKLLKEELDHVVEQCVSMVGVNVNTASPWLLRYVAGIGPSLAGAIIAWRSEKGPFRSREELLKVPRLGPKVYQQCAGFLRIAGGDQPLDNSAVHPEAYAVVDKMAASLGIPVAQLIGNKEKINLLEDRVADFADERFGVPTLQDILAELAKPGRDPRQPAGAFAFSEEIHEIEDLVVGMEVPGLVTNVTDFGAFVNIGVHKEGLIHTSTLRDKKGRPATQASGLLKINEQVLVRVVSVDLDRNRIGLQLVSKFIG